ncbi:MAG: AMP-binding protein, partial [Nitrospiria bacterium]
MRLEEVVSQAIELWPTRVAVVHKGRSWTYADLGDHAASRKKRIGEAGFSEGDRVLLWMENSEEYIA